MITESIYQRALNKWGVAMQNDMLIEECAEAIEAISHYRRCKCDADEVIGELADVQILLNQMKLVYGEDRFDRIFAEKLEALEAKLDMDE